MKAFYDAGLPNFVQSNPFLVRFDNDGPRIAVSAIDGGSIFKRDESVLFVVQGDEPLSLASLAFDGQPQPGVNCPTATCSPASHCRCFIVDMSQPPLPGLDGGFVLAAAAQDLLLNSTTRMDAGFANITRLRWSFSPPGMSELRAAPALGADGTLYIGGADGILAIKPSGEMKTGWPDGGARVGTVQSLAVGESTGVGEVVFYAANVIGSGSLIAGVSAQTGLPLNPSNMCNSVGSTFSGIALAEGGGLYAVGAMGIPMLADGGVNAARPCAFTPQGSYEVGVNTAEMLGPVIPGAAGRTAANISIENSNVHFIGHGQRVFSARFTGTWSVPVSARLGAANSSVAFIGSAPFRDGAGFSLALGGSPLGDFHTLTPAGIFSTKSVGQNFVGPPVVLALSSDVAFFTGVYEDPFPTIDQFRASQSSRVQGPRVADVVMTPPVLAEGGRGYAVGENGGLTVFSTANFTSAREWGAKLPNNSVSAPPTLDCIRDSNGSGVPSRVGVLYVVSTGGLVTAVIVDSPKLDTTPDSWPKYQRTAGNAGNTDTRFPLNPGCP